MHKLDPAGTIDDADLALLGYSTKWVEHGYLTSEFLLAQVAQIMAHPRLQELPRLVKKQRLLRALRSRDVTEETLQRCVEEGDGGVHRALLKRPALPQHILEALHRAGASKAVRNIAGARLKKDDQGAAKSVRRDRE